ncbi:hypothetical protein MKW94_008719 [Papaver nudicaule]|uniref:Protein NUCLEAR FUSION DEFECTIVE 6, chloroplastic/mitochondrial-like n=1 Tax=Papaver nudicaule TaxID=74823 RepID=A0AA41SG98_PAPNU|nr:hypothetical protein [Papaver nudicaule]
MAASRIFLSRLSSLRSSPSLSSKLKTKPSISSSPLKTASATKSQISDSMNRISRNSRLPVLGSLMSMMPLHSAIASARLQSILSSESQSWGLIPQGNSMPL